jgi:TetR/AcrR family transcriptional regulator, acrAB operon repressor
MSKRQEMTDRTQRALLDAAQELIAEDGYRGATIQQIAERAGISRGSIAWHFGSKLGLFEAALNDMLRKYREQFRRELEQVDDGTLVGKLEANRRVIEAQWPGIVMFMREALRPTSEFRTKYAEMYDERRQEVLGWLEDMEWDDLPDDLDREDVAFLYWSLIVGAHIQWILDHERIDLERVYRSIEWFLTRFVSDRKRAGVESA